MIFVNVETVVYDWVIAVKRKWCAEALCAPPLFWLQPYKWLYGLCGIVHFTG